MLKIENMSVSYGSVRALTEVDLEVRGDGVLHGVIGPNGAGKSTLLDAVCGRRRPTAGTVRYRDEDITRRSIAWRRRSPCTRIRYSARSWWPPHILSSSFKPPSGSSRTADSMAPP